MLRILIEDSEGKSKTAQIDPDSGDITIGRKEGNFIRLKERNVSRQHARIFLEGNELMIEPVAARYGLKLNSKKIEGPTPLQLGDEIRIGDYRLYIQDESQPVAVNNENADVISDIEYDMQPRLVVVSSNFAGREYRVSRSKVIIGRNPTCDIQIGHASVSGEHAEIRRNARGDFEVRDLNSSNGTKINGYPLSEPYRINSGDVIMLGHVIMRYCAPGDFWSLNFGINDEAPKKSGNIIIISILIALLLGCGAYIAINAMQPKETNQPAPVQTDDTAVKNSQFLEHIVNCKTYMAEGDFDLARSYCEKAGAINPSDSRYTLEIAKLEQEESAQKALDAVKKAIQEERCREAISGLESVKENTAAYSKMLADRIKDEAVDCLASAIANRAMNSLDAGDIVEAEIARDEIKTIQPNSPRIAEINDKIRALKARSSGSSGGSKASAKKQDEAPVAPKPASGGDVKEICSQAVRAKIQKKNCEAYKLYKKALATGGADATCTRNAKTHLTTFKAECD